MSFHPRVGPSLALPSKQFTQPVAVLILAGPCGNIYLRLKVRRGHCGRPLGVSWSADISDKTDPSAASLNDINSFLASLPNSTRKVSLRSIRKHMSFNTQYIFSVTAVNFLKQTQTSNLPLTIESKKKPVVRVGAKIRYTYANNKLVLRCELALNLYLNLSIFTRYFYKRA